MRVMIWAVLLALMLGACGKMGDNEAPPGADPARSKDVFKKPR